VDSDYVTDVTLRAACHLMGEDFLSHATAQRRNVKSKAESGKLKPAIPFDKLQVVWKRDVFGVSLSLGFTPSGNCSPPTRVTSVNNDFDDW